MDRNSTVYQTYLQILKEELVPAMGCTEPIAVAYCAAKARQVLGKTPDRVVVEASGNMHKRDIREVAACGVDIISIGGLTHSVAAMDISLEFRE